MHNKTFNTISFNLFSLKDFQSQELAANVIKTINGFFEFLPDNYDYYEPLKNIYKVDEPQGVVAIWFNEQSNIAAAADNFAGSHLMMQKKKPYKAEYVVSWKKDNMASFNNFSFTIDLSFFKGKGGMNRFISFCEKVAEIIEPVYGSISNCSFPDWGEPTNIRVRLPNPAWVTILGKPYIELFSYDTIMKSPYLSAKEINSDLIFLQLTESLFEQVGDTVKNALKGHLGEDAFVGINKDYRSYKSGKTPVFDFSNVLFDKNQPIVEPQIKTRPKK